MKTKIMFIISLVMVMISSHDSSAQQIEVTLAGKSGGEITASQLASDSILFPEEGYSILSFRLTISAKFMTSPKEYEVKGARLTPEMLKTISLLRAGTKVYFEFIRIQDDNGKIKSGKPMAFTIK
jgi:hypothetical protein